MEGLGIPELVFAALVLTAGYAVRGTAGFGGQAVAVPLLTLVFPLPLVVASVAVLTALSSYGHWRRDRDKVVWREILMLAPYTVAGVIVGIYVLNQVDVRTLTRAFGAFVILYACFTLATAARPVPVPARILKPLGAVLSVLAGLAGALFGAAAGPLYAIYLNARALGKDSFRVTITTILTVLAISRVAGYASLGLYNEVTLLLIGAGLPLMVLGSYIGYRLAGRLDQRAFNRVVAVLLFVSGVALLFK